MKNKTGLLIIPALLIAGIIIYFLTTAFAGNYLNKEVSDSCSSLGKTHKAAIKNDTVKPKITHAKRCDRLVISNLDDKARKVSFGVHDKHIAYDGITEKLLNRNQSFTITLIKNGNYVFHDHFQEETGGQFTVK